MLFNRLFASAKVPATELHFLPSLFDPIDLTQGGVTIYSKEFKKRYPYVTLAGEGDMASIPTWVAEARNGIQSENTRDFFAEEYFVWATSEMNKAKDRDNRMVERGYQDYQMAFENDIQLHQGYIDILKNNKTISSIADAWLKFTDEKFTEICKKQIKIDADNILDKLNVLKEFYIHYLYELRALAFIYNKYVIHSKPLNDTLKWPDSAGMQPKQEVSYVLECFNQFNIKEKVFFSELEFINTPTAEGKKDLEKVFTWYLEHKKQQVIQRFGKIAAENPDLNNYSEQLKEKVNCLAILVSRFINSKDDSIIFDIYEDQKFEIENALKISSETHAQKLQEKCRRDFLEFKEQSANEVLSKLNEIATNPDSAEIESAMMKTFDDSLKQRFQESQNETMLFITREYQKMEETLNSQVSKTSPTKNTEAEAIQKLELPIIRMEREDQLLKRVARNLQAFIDQGGLCEGKIRFDFGYDFALGGRKLAAVMLAFIEAKYPRAIIQGLTREDIKPYENLYKRAKNTFTRQIKTQAFKDAAQSLKSEKVKAEVKTPEEKVDYQTALDNIADPGVSKRKEQVYEEKEEYIKEHIVRFNHWMLRGTNKYVGIHAGKHDEDKYTLERGKTYKLSEDNILALKVENDGSHTLIYRTSEMNDWTSATAATNILVAAVTFGAMLATIPLTPVVALYMSTTRLALTGAIGGGAIAFNKTRKWWQSSEKDKQFHQAIETFAREDNHRPVLVCCSDPALASKIYFDLRKNGYSPNRIFGLSADVQTRAEADFREKESNVNIDPEPALRGP